MQGSCQLEKIERKDRPDLVTAEAMMENKKYKLKRVKKARQLARRKAHGQKIVALRGGNKID